MDWIRGNTIGHGSSATVSVATNHRSNEVFAVKSVELSKSKILQREQRILSSIKSSPYVVDYIGCDVTNENGNVMYNLFMEYVAGGTLSGLIQNQGGRLEEDLIRSYSNDILLGLDYLHMNGLVHCDIKGRNILIGKNGAAKLADLGCARWVDDGTEVSISGTPVFMAPEVARGEEQGFPADVWALGCTMIEMATGRLPWPEVKNNMSALYRIGFSEQVPEFPSYLSEEAKDFLSKCLRRNPKERWTTCQLLTHPFLNQATPFSKIQVSTSNSPTSILDQDVWDSIEESHTEGLNSSSSAVERIRKMSSPVAPIWVLDEDWITIRTNEAHDDCSDRVRDEPATVSGSDTSDEEAMEMFRSSVSHMDFMISSLGDIRSNSNGTSSIDLFSERCYGEVCTSVDTNLIFETQRDFSYSFNTNLFRP